MQLVRISDLIGKPIAGLKADIRSRHATGELQHPELRCDAEPIIVTMKSVAIEQRGYVCGCMSQRPGQTGKFPWLYWRWDGYSCGYSGHRIDNGRMPEEYILMEPLLEGPK